MKYRSRGTYGCWRYYSDIIGGSLQCLYSGLYVRANSQVRNLADEQGVEIRYYNVIYDLVDDMKAAMSGVGLIYAKPCSAMLKYLRYLMSLNPVKWQV